MAAATAAYPAQLPPVGHARATAYTRAGHWLLLGGCIVAILVSLVLIRSGVLTGRRDRLERKRPYPWLTSLVIAPAGLPVGFAQVGRRHGPEGGAYADG